MLLMWCPTCPGMEPACLVPSMSRMIKEKKSCIYLFKQLVFDFFQFCFQRERIDSIFSIGNLFFPFYRRPGRQWIFFRFAMATGWLLAGASTDFFKFAMATGWLLAGAAAAAARSARVDFDSLGQAPAMQQLRARGSIRGWNRF